MASPAFPVSQSVGAAPASLTSQPAPRSLTPLLPVGVAATLGIMTDRFLYPPSFLILLAGVLAIALCVAAGWRRQQRAALWALLILTGVLAAGWHHVRQRPAQNDLLNLPVTEIRVARLRGVVLDVQLRATSDDPLRFLPAEERTVILVRATGLQGAGDWLSVTGRCRVLTPGRSDVAVGDAIEVLGELRRAEPPSNSGEGDVEAFFRDQGIGAELSADHAAAVRVLESGSLLWPDAALARIRWWAGEQLDQRLPSDQAALARALLLGDQAALARGQFQSFQRTGVYHILAISGQHLAILAFLLWPLLRLLPLPLSRRALILALAVIFYALLTGGRPPILRAAVMVCTFAGGLMLRRPVQPVNSLALAWLLVIVLNPADVFQIGCQISFLCVLVLLEVLMPLEQAWSQRDPLEQLIARNRPQWLQVLARLGRWLLWAYAGSALLLLVVTPLTALHYHLISPGAVVLGPPLVILSSLALIAGFLFLLASPLGPVAAWPFAGLLSLSLQGCQQLVELTEAIPLAYWYTAGPPAWWLIVLYAGVLAWLLLPALRRFWRLFLLASLAWLCVLLALPGHRADPHELRCTVLAVGHGSCAVVETPDGRVLVCDAGALGGPELTARQLAPFLWSRGISRIDEVYLSHADLDHFNGVPALLERFRIGQVSVTPSFFSKTDRGVTRLADELLERAIPVRVLNRGQTLDAGPLTIEALHPPADGPTGTENARSMVLLLRYRDWSVLLTGDLEEPGLSQVLAQPAPKVDVLIAPHHGSTTSNTELFAAWAKPRFVVVSEGRERGKRVNPYEAVGAELWRTSREGAVLIRMDEAGIQADGFKSRRRWQGP